MTNVVQQARYDGLIRRAAGLLGPGSKVSETLSEVLTATLGETSRASLFNPAGSGRLVVLTDVYVSISPITNVAFATITTAFASAQTSGLPRDTRTTANSGAKVSNLNTGNTGQIGSWAPEDNITWHGTADGGLFVLAPGTGIDFGTTGDNIGMRITFFWKERDALPSELSF